MNERQSIKPTYDHRETGDRYFVQYSINSKLIGESQSITDPFVRGTVVVGWRDILKSLLRHRSLKVEMRVRGDQSIEEDVMELDANYTGVESSTRRRAFRAAMESGLQRLAMTPADEELS